MAKRKGTLDEGLKKLDRGMKRETTRPQLGDSRVRRVPGPARLDPGTGLAMKRGRPVEAADRTRASFFGEGDPAQKFHNSAALHATINRPLKDQIPTAASYYRDLLKRKKRR